MVQYRKFPFGVIPLTINQIIMYIIAFGALLGGADRMLGNRFGYGEKFENGFKMLGPVGLSMAGIICLAPVLSALLGTVVRPLFTAMGLDAGILGSILAIDMGGYQLSLDLANDPAIGLFSGAVVSSIFGCTIVYNIPVGLGFISEEDRPHFTKGILLGLTAMPFAIIAGGLVMGLAIGHILWNSLPVLLISAFLALGVIKKPDAMMKGFQAFARIIKIVATFGLALAAFTHLTGITILPMMPPLLEAMKTVSSICIVMLGSMPLAELIQRLMRVPFRWIGKKTGLNGASTTALLLGLVSATPALAMIPEMNRRGKVVISAALVSCVCTFGAHFAFANTMAPELVPALLTAKLTGCFLGLAIGLLATRQDHA